MMINGEGNRFFSIFAAGGCCWWLPWRLQPPPWCRKLRCSGLLVLDVVHVVGVVIGAIDAEGKLQQPCGGC
ncbi:hypothetical protein SOVF_062450 [Spinacia oleracea]|nr:hypothetical protein SOVF_062450 [Spinacia oleracea]